MFKSLSVTILLIIAAALSNVFARGSCFFITNPYIVTKWTAGTTVEVTWELPECDVSYSSINVQLMSGDPLKADQVHTIANNLPLNTTRTEWAIPSNLLAGDNYFVNVEGIHSGAIAVERYSHAFQIIASSSTTTSSSSTTATRTSTSNSTSSNSSNKISNNNFIVPFSVLGMVIVSLML